MSLQNNVNCISVYDESIADQIKNSIPAGRYIFLVEPPQNLNSDQMKEKILKSLPVGTKVVKIMG